MTDSQNDSRELLKRHIYGEACEWVDNHEGAKELTDWIYNLVTQRDLEQMRKVYSEFLRSDKHDAPYDYVVNRIAELERQLKKENKDAD